MRNKGKNVVSLFDGMSCAMIGFDMADINVGKYYASEIDKYATLVSKKNYPDIIRLGDVTKWKEWDIDWASIDLVMAGSPCQGFSFAGKQLAFDDPRSKLFFVFIDILKHVKSMNPKVNFLLENVVMVEEYNDVISSLLGEIYPERVTQSDMFRAGRLEPIMINSALVSAQNRKRLYWCNWEVEQPRDKGIVLKDILQGDLEIERKTINNKVKEATQKGYVEAKVGEGLDLTFPQSKTRRGRLMKTKCNTLTAANYEYGIVETCIQIGEADLNGHDIIKRVYSPNGKSPTLTSNTGGNQEPKTSTDMITWRKLTPLECERLQTVPDNYTDCVSNSQRHKMLGNGWTVDVIAHILKGLYKIIT